MPPPVLCNRVLEPVSRCGRRIEQIQLLRATPRPQRRHRGQPQRLPQQTQHTRTDPTHRNEPNTSEQIQTLAHFLGRLPTQQSAANRPRTPQAQPQRSQRSKREDHPAHTRPCVHPVFGASASYAHFYNSMFLFVSFVLFVVKSSRRFRSTAPRRRAAVGALVAASVPDHDLAALQAGRGVFLAAPGLPVPPLRGAGRGRGGGNGGGCR
jgi:hypothetical protein